MHFVLSFGSYGYRSVSPFCKSVHLREKRCRWRFKTTFNLQKRLSFWPSEVALPFIPVPCSGDVCSSCLGVWIAELERNNLPVLDSSCDLYDSEVWKSILRLKRYLPCNCWGSFEFVQQPGEFELRVQHRELTLHPSRTWRFVRTLPGRFSLRRLWGTVSVSHTWRTFGFVFHFDTDAKTVRQGKIVMS